MFRRLFRFLRRAVTAVRVATALLSLAASLPIPSPRPYVRETWTRDDFLSLNRTSCGWTAI